MILNLEKNMKLKAIENCEIEYAVKLDFKDNYQQWFKTFCAFANTDGGVFYVGVNDNLDVVGYSMHEIDSLKRSIENICRNHSKPILKCKYEEVQIEEGKDLYYLKVTIQKRTSITWFIDNKTNPLLYVRHEGSTDFATIEEQIKLITTSNMFEYDQVETGVSYDECTFEDLDEEYRSSHDNEALTKKKMIGFGLVTEEGYLTVAGVLFADNSLSKNANISCTTWPSLNKGTNDYIDSKYYSGSLISLLHSALLYIRSVSHYYFGGDKKGLYRENKGSFDIDAIREALVNALAHRDYKIDGNEIAINCFPDRIEITSPGTMLQAKNDIVRETIDTDRFPSIRRNRTICTVFEKCGLMENKGSGFEKIVEDYKDLGEDYCPLISTNRVSFTIILKNKKYKYNDSLTKNDVVTIGFDKLMKSPMFMPRQALFSQNPKFQLIEKLISSDKFIKIDEIGSEVGLTKDGVKYNIRKMKDACLIRRGQSGYELVNDMDRPADCVSLEKDTLIRAVNWCKDHFISSDTVLDGYSSYQLKDYVRSGTNIYLSNGQLKAVMLFAGFVADNIEKLNWSFKISKKSPALK